jgi:hypothetical protein
MGNDTIEGPFAQIWTDLPGPPLLLQWRRSV